MDSSVFAAVFRNGFSEVLMVLNAEKSIVEKRGEKDVYKAFFTKDEGWGCPGGGVEGGETIWNAASREAREEAGIGIFVDGDTPFVKSRTGEGHQKIYFAVTVFDGEPKANSNEVKAVAWIPLKIILSDEQSVYSGGRRIYNGHRQGIKELLRKLGEIS